MQNMETSRAGFGALTSLHHALSRFDSLKIELDCTDVSWLDGNMAAPLGGILQLSKSLFE